MPNYGLVVNSTFQPFTYQELAAPLDRQELYHEKLAEEYDKLSTQADVLEAMGQNDRDKSSGAYSRYKAYSDRLRKEADDLYRFGLNTESRQRLTDLRRRYNTDIVPIQNAWTKREKEADDQMKATLQNPSLMFTRDARNTTLDDYIRNPTGGYGVINGANITAQMAGMAKNLANQVRSGNRQNIDAYTYNYIENHGLDENLIRNWQDSPTLSAMFRQVMESNGVTPEALNGSANMQNIIDKSTGYAEMGMWNAMGEDKSHIVEDYGARIEAQAAKEMAVAREKANMNNNQGTTSAAINPSNIYAQEESAEQIKRIKNFERYFIKTSDGRTVLTKEGLDEYNRNATKDASLASSGGQTARVMNAETNLNNNNRKFTPTEFREFIDEIGGAELVKKKQFGNLGNLWNQYKGMDFLKYDATKLTEYNHNIDPSEYTNWTDRIRERAGGELEEVKWDKKKKAWVPNGRVPVSEVFKKNSNPVSTQSSIFGRTFRVVDENGNVKRYRMPRGINSRAEQNIDIHLNALSTVQSLANQLDNRGEKRLTVAEAQQLNQATGSNIFVGGMVINYATLQRVNTELENRLATFESQMGVTNTNKPQEWSAIPY